MKPFVANYGYLQTPETTTPPSRPVDLSMFSPEGTEALAEVMVAAVNGVPAEVLRLLVDAAEALGHTEIRDSAVREVVLSWLPTGPMQALADAMDIDTEFYAMEPVTEEKARAYLAQALEVPEPPVVDAGVRPYEVLVRRTENISFVVAATSPDGARESYLYNGDEQWSEAISIEVQSVREIA